MWSLSIQTKRMVKRPVHPSTSEVGIDVGVVRFATLSTGKFIEPLNSFKRHEDRAPRLPNDSNALSQRICVLAVKPLAMVGTKMGTVGTIGHVAIK